MFIKQNNRSSYYSDIKLMIDKCHVIVTISNKIHRNFNHYTAIYHIIERPLNINYKFNLISNVVDLNYFKMKKEFFFFTVFVSLLFHRISHLYFLLIHILLLIIYFISQNVYKFIFTFS